MRNIKAPKWWPTKGGATTGHVRMHQTVIVFMAVATTWLAGITAYLLWEAL